MKKFALIAISLFLLTSIAGCLFPPQGKIWVWIKNKTDATLRVDIWIDGVYQGKTWLEPGEKNQYELEWKEGMQPHQIVIKSLYNDYVIHDAKANFTSNQIETILYPDGSVEIIEF